MNEFTLFIGTFIVVFALGLQSLNVNAGHKLAAAFTSLFIGSSQLVLFKLAPHANWSEMLAFVAGGPFGITASMWLHPHLVRIIRRHK